MIVEDLFEDFAEHSTIHGVNYIAEKERSWFERIWWIMVFCMSLLCCGKLIVDAWNISPIIISFAAKPTPIWKIPFPAVTICPKTFVRLNNIHLTEMASRFDKGLPYLDNLTELEKKQADAKFTFCHEKEFYKVLFNLSNCNDCINVLREIIVPPEEIFIECRFEDQPFDCAVKLVESIAGYTICYTFNGLDIYRKDSQIEEPLSNDWSIDEGYRPTATMDVYPRRASIAGIRFGLSVLMKINNMDNDLICIHTPGFWAEYTMPHEIPKITSNAVNIRAGEQVIITISPNMLKTSTELRNYPVTSRKCFFGDERPLKYFKTYTQTNCENDCLAENMLKSCGCLPAFVKDPRNIDICGSLQATCYGYVNGFLFWQHFHQCDCLPACSLIRFESEITSTVLNENSTPSNRFAYSRLTIYFKEDEFLTSERTELYGRTDFLANCGGLCGLCLGVSVLSFVEIIYFCTIRLYFNLKFGRNKYHDHDQVEEFENLNSKSKRHLETMKNLILEYFTKTTIQGFNFITDTALSLTERVYWLIVMIISILCCGSLIHDVFKHYDQSPVIISYENAETPISVIPFPAVTVCPQIVSQFIPRMYYDFKVQNISLYTLDAASIDYITAVAQVCDPDIFGDLDPKNQTNCNYCAQMLYFMMGSVDQLFSRCKHIYHENIGCSSMFAKTINDGGVCYVYNSLDVYRQNYTIDNNDLFDHWSLESGYKVSTDDVNVYPRAGSKYGLIANLLAHKLMDDGLCKGPFRGFKIYLHLPNEVPQISNRFILLPYQQLVRILIYPQMIKAEPELRELSLAKRQCYFSDERYLKYFKTYTQNNCEYECLINMTISKCGCQMFYMFSAEELKFCGIGEIHCYQLVLQTIVERRIKNDQYSICDCLPTCTSISYGTEINQISLSDAENISEYVENHSTARFSVVFKENQFVALKRSQLYGKIEFLANCGGLLGLFLGVSLISVLEIIYFCTLRLICNLKK